MDVFATKFQIFALIFARVMAMLSVAPVFSGQSLSFFYRGSIAFFISLLLTTVINFPEQYYTLLETRYFTMLLEQAFMGILIGISLQFLFAAFQMAGEFFSVQMGFGISEVLDPVSQISLPLIGTVINTIGVFVFFISKAHLYLIEAIVYSFEKIPYLSLNFLNDANSMNGLIKFFVLISSGMFIIALKIALPVMGTLLMVTVTLGLLYKAAPQMNVMMLGFPLKIMVAFFILATLSPVIVDTMMAQFDTFFSHMDGLISTWPKPL